VSKTRRTGTDHENQTRDYLNANGFGVEREAFSSPLGDLKGAPATIECKSHKHITLSDFLEQTKRSDARTGHDMPIVVVKRRQHNIKDAYFVTDLEHGARLLKAYQICIENGLLEEGATDG
jgi:hypothetical protein